MLSESVQVAIVTFASGAVGALFGYLGARHSARTQIKKSAMDSYFTARLDAYATYYERYAEYIQHAEDASFLAQILTAIARARLVASQETSDILEDISEQLVDIKTLSIPSDAFHELRAQLLISMQNDLRCFSESEFK